VLQRSSQRRPALFDAPQPGSATLGCGSRGASIPAQLLIDSDKRSSWEWPPVPLSLR